MKLLKIAEASEISGIPKQTMSNRREYLRQYNRRWMAKRRAEWFDGKACVECGSTEEREVDHIDPSQKIDHKVWSWSKERRDAELAKCQVLCRRCHTAKSIRENHRPRVHGTVAMYKRGNCRCELCREAKRRYVAQNYNGATLIFVRPSDLRSR